MRICVSDRGPGIPESFRDVVFEKFSQADASDTRASGGTGLGLAISKELVERMGGTIGYESTEGHGATFFVDLPIASERPDQRGGQHHPPALSDESQSADQSSDPA